MRPIQGVIFAAWFRLTFFSSYILAIPAWLLNVCMRMLSQSMEQPKLSILNVLYNASTGQVLVLLSLLLNLDALSVDV